MSGPSPNPQAAFIPMRLSASRLSLLPFVCRTPAGRRSAPGWNMSHAAHAVVLRSWPAACVPVCGRGSWLPYTHPPTHNTCPRRLSPGRWPTCTHTASRVCLLARCLTPAPPSPSLAPGRPPAGMGEAHFAHGMCRACFLEFFSATGGLYAGHNPPAFEAARERERRAAEAAAAAAQARGALAGGEQVLALPAPPGALRGGDDGGGKGWGSLRCAALCLCGFFLRNRPSIGLPRGSAAAHGTTVCLGWPACPGCGASTTPFAARSSTACIHRFFTRCIAVGAMCRQRSERRQRCGGVRAGGAGNCRGHGACT